VTLAIAQIIFVAGIEPRLGEGYGIPCKTKISNSKYQVQMSNIKFKFISQVQKQNIKFKPKNIKFI
jgi:hypothetical protein